MTCDTWRERLDAYIDDSFPPEELNQLEEHLRVCPSCAAEALHRLKLKHATKAAAAARFAPSSEFRSRIAQGMPSRRKRLFGDLWIPGLAVAAAILIALAGSSVWEWHAQRQQALAELVDLHVTTLASVNPVDVISTDRHTVKPWFQGKLPFSFNLPELENSPFRLLGGKLVYFNHAPGAQLLCASGKHQISVFILQGDWKFALSGTFPASAREKGFNIESTRSADLRILLVSDANPGDIHELAELLKAAQQP
jgi:anti-sigma factor RsiW